MKDILELKNVKKQYKGNTVVNGLSFTVEQGSVFALLGANGAGKTTTIKMILGLTPLNGGEIIREENVKIGYSPETPFFPPFLTGIEVLDYYAAVQKTDKKIRQDETRKLLELVGLEVNKTKVKNYSKGMLQRLALAQCLIGDPELLILDEPTAGLDALGRTHMMNLLLRLKEEGKTIIINSHILSDVERICDRGVILKKGEVVGTWNGKEEHKQSLEEMFLALVETGEEI